MMRRPGRSTLLLTVVVVLGVLAGSSAAAARAPRLNLVPDDGVERKLGLFMDGRFVGMVERLDGCGIGALVVGPASWDSTDLRLGARVAPPCEIRHGRLSKSFMAWLSSSLAGTARPTTLRLVSYRDGLITQPGAAVELRGARLSQLWLPRIDQSGTTAQFKTVLIASAIDPVDAAGNAAPSAKGTSFNPSRFTLTVDGVVRPRIRSVVPLVIAALFGPGMTEPTGPDAAPGVMHPSDLVLTAAESGRSYFDKWLDDLLGGAREPERTVVLRYLDGYGATLLTVTLEGVGIAGADAGLHPTLRTYAFYVQTVRLTYP